MNTTIKQTDRVEMIRMTYGSRRPGTYGMGVQVLHRLPADQGHDIERYAIIIDDSETRETIANKLRKLANAVESGEGSVHGETILAGCELNALEYPALLPKSPDDVHSSDFRPDGYDEWREEAMRAIDKLTKTRPISLP